MIHRNVHLIDCFCTIFGWSLCGANFCRMFPEEADMLLDLKNEEINKIASRFLNIWFCVDVSLQAPE